MSRTDRNEALKTLRRNQAKLRAHGIDRIALFGSVARGDNRPSSDIDVLVEFDAKARLTIFDYVEIKRLIADLLPGRVDVVNAATLRQGVAESAARDAIYAF